MPGRDGTGPLGMGPMTGRGMGYCARPVRGAWDRGCRPYGLGASPYAGYGVPDSPAPDKERLADIEKTLTEQLAEVRRMQAQLNDTQSAE